MGKYLFKKMTLRRSVNDAFDAPKRYIEDSANIGVNAFTGTGTGAVCLNTAFNYCVQTVN